MRQTPFTLSALSALLYFSKTALSIIFLQNSLSLSSRLCFWYPYVKKKKKHRLPVPARMRKLVLPGEGSMRRRRRGRRCQRSRGPRVLTIMVDRPASPGTSHESGNQSLRYKSKASNKCQKEKRKT